MKRRQKKSASRISRRFREEMNADMPVTRDAKYWLIHAFHWHAMLLALIALLTVGYSFF